MPLSITLSALRDHHFPPVLPPMLLLSRFAGVTSAGMAVEDEQTNAEDQHCRRETERLQLAARLASLAATAEHRTRGER